MQHTAEVVFPGTLVDEAVAISHKRLFLLKKDLDYEYVVHLKKEFKSISCFLCERSLRDEPGVVNEPEPGLVRREPQSFKIEAVGIFHPGHKYDD